MRFKEVNPPRTFRVGSNGKTTIKDCAHIKLEPDEQITLITEEGAEYDVARKSWGYYATPSINGRLRAQGLRTALVRNRDNRYYIMLVESLKRDEFFEYLQSSGQEIIEWLDDRN